MTGRPRSTSVPDDPTPTLDAEAHATFASIADALIPAAHGMPSAADVVSDDRIQFVLNARPDLLGPLRSALRAGLGDVRARLDTLQRDEPANLAALQLVIVGGYYTDKQVRALIGYPGQMAIELKSWLYPAYLEEGLIDALLARGPAWRDPETGRRSRAAEAPRTYAERWSTATGSPEGGTDGRDGT